MENSPFIDDFPINTSVYRGFSMAMLVITIGYLLNNGHFPREVAGWDGVLGTMEILVPETSGSLSTFSSADTDMMTLRVGDIPCNTGGMLIDSKRVMSTEIAIELKWPIEIVSFPSYNMVIFHCYVSLPEGIFHSIFIVG